MIDTVNEPVIDQKSTERGVFGAGLAISLLLHALPALLLIENVAGFDTPSASPPIDVELVLEPSSQEEPAEVPEQPSEEAQEPPQEAEEQQTEETDLPDEQAPEPEPSQTDALIGQQDLTEPHETSLPIFQGVQEFAEEATAPDEADIGSPENSVLEENTDPSADEPPDAFDQAADEVAASQRTTETDAQEPLTSDVIQSEDTVSPVDTEGALETDASTDATEAVDSPEETDQALTESTSAPEEISAPQSAIGVPVPRSRPVTAANTSPEAQSGELSAPPLTGLVGPLTTARQLYSERVLSDPRVRTAINAMPEGQRLNLLCVTELRAQLETAIPPIRPDILPSFRPESGTVLERDTVAFRSFGQWYDFAFRCETDPEVRRVVTFSYQVGNPIPRSEWQARGFPAN